ncbi:mucin-2-like [Cheilinus undulatus]|uniref:mucin-2-like n=1 Tax=Cheilinus undulatus TaxID=241271 RepID=UPI001BD1EECC|nr:mucin-2-like [Cheilinus undulatus]
MRGGSVIGTVFDDIGDSGCVPVSDCPCMHNGKVYRPGTSYQHRCRSCDCQNGRWKCTEEKCPGHCFLMAGCHIKTFDGKFYTFHGDCSYVMFKVVKCRASERCDVQHIQSELPMFGSDIKAFKQSTFFIFIETKFDVVIAIQLVPMMQVYIRADHSLKKSLRPGLCGTFNDNSKDDFKTVAGLPDTTPTGFGNAMKSLPTCPDVYPFLTNPCYEGIDKEKFADFWCPRLKEPSGMFQQCHHHIDPKEYYKACKYSSCLCDDPEMCMCAIMSTYVQHCRSKGVNLIGWRDKICKKYTVCPETMVYHYNASSCGRTCRSLNQPDHSCQADFSAVDGCVCADGFYLNDKNRCVLQKDCPCYEKDEIFAPGQTVTRRGARCHCRHGKLHCGGGPPAPPTCAPPLVYVNCSLGGSDTVGVECQKTCYSQDDDSECRNVGCQSGCVCPEGLVSNGRGGCIKTSNCPCVHNGKIYQPGETLTVDCNTCSCKNRTFTCTKTECPATCRLYGSGHFTTFDGLTYGFNGQCEYTLLQDSCNGDKNKGSFQIITESVECGSLGTACSKIIKVFYLGMQFELSDGSFHVAHGVLDHKVHIYRSGNFQVVTLLNGISLMWDEKTTLYIRATSKFMGRVCGLCGNYDDNSQNDYLSPSGDVLGESQTFGDSWKALSSCPSPPFIPDPCILKPSRASWAKKHCSIINSVTFQSCHSEVDPSEYFDNCVSDSCSCDTGGDCECFCTAVAAYARACAEAGTCVRWRNPNLCPIFCDYYNSPDECEWHYKPCGAPCMKTCRNPLGKCPIASNSLEGCYPHCPPSHPYFDEDSMKCVTLEECGCYDFLGLHYKVGEKMPADNCYTW